ARAREPALGPPGVRRSARSALGRAGRGLGPARRLVRRRARGNAPRVRVGGPEDVGRRPGAPAGLSSIRGESNEPQTLGVRGPRVARDWTVGGQSNALLTRRATAAAART